MLPCHTPTAALTSTGGCLLLIVLSTRVCTLYIVFVKLSLCLIVGLLYLKKNIKA